MLNNGCISYILTGGVPEGAKDVAVQVLEMKRVDSKQQGNAPVRYRLIISDGQHYTQAMLATQLNGLVDDGSLPDDGSPEAVARAADAFRPL